jgi:hypothetical protein
MFVANPVGAVAAVCLTLCGAPFAATDRSHRDRSAATYCRSGHRPRRVTAVYLTLCGAPFAATGRSYSVNSNRLTSAPGNRLELV